MGMWPVVIRYVLFATPVAIIIISSFRYISREKSIDAMLLFAGSLMAFLAFTFNTFFTLFDRDGSIEYTYNWVVPVGTIIGLLGMFLFAFGFLTFVRKFLRRQKGIQNEVDQIGKG